MQSNWPTGDYRSGRFTVEALAPEDAGWRPVAQGRMPTAGGSKRSVRLPGRPVRGLRLRILDSQDAPGGHQLWPGRLLRLRSAGKELSLERFEIRASSEYPGHPTPIPPRGRIRPRPGGPLRQLRLRDVRRAARSWKAGDWRCG